MDKQFHDTVLSISREELLAFARECESIAADLHAERATLLGDWSGRNEAAAPGRKTYGVRVSVGVKDFPHPGRSAGDTLAGKIAWGVFAVIGVEDGARALGGIARQALADMGDQDGIAATELAGMIRDVEPGGE